MCVRAYVLVAVREGHESGWEWQLQVESEDVAGAANYSACHSMSCPVFPKKVSAARAHYVRCTFKGGPPFAASTLQFGHEKPFMASTCFLESSKQSGWYHSEHTSHSTINLSGL